MGNHPRLLMRDEVVAVARRDELTLNEQWNVGNRTGHWYAASTEFALGHLGFGNGRSCLVVGSPIFEALALRKQGWDVTYLDIRTPPDVPFKVVQGDAADMSFEDASFDAVSSACVLTHVGTGRYGDALDMLHGDERMLAHVARVMKPGATSALTFGAVADMPKMVRRGATHRIYTIPECRRMLGVVGLEIGETRVWSSATKQWLWKGEPMTQSMNDPDYISFMVKK